MSHSANGLVTFVKKQVGVPYVYGAKGQVVTESLITLWARQSPGVYSAVYKAKARKYIGKVANDCSGLISRYTGVLRGSSNFHDTAIKVLPISQINEDCVGWAVWKRGHIGVYIGGGEVVEARGIDYGTIRISRASNNWTSVIKLKDIDYSNSTSTTSASNEKFGFDVVDYQIWLNKYYGDLIKEVTGELLAPDNKLGTKTRNATLLVWKYRMNKKDLGYTFDLRNTYFGPTCIKLGNAQVVSLGRKTRDVYIAQGLLRTEGYYTGALDGHCGPIMDKAIREYQSANGLKVDGECGAKTWNKLFN